jgi:purine-cytosine permease-like protein
MLTRGLKRGTSIGFGVSLVVALYVWIRYRPDTLADFAPQYSNSLFQIGLLFLVIGVVIFTRLFSFRRRYNLPRIFPIGKTPEDEKEFQMEDEEKNIRDAYELEEKGRDTTFLISALVMIVISILATINLMV